MPFNLVSWNVGKKGGHPEQIRAIGSVGSVEVDILTLQEVTASNANDSKAKLTEIGLRYVLPGAFQGSGLLIASRWRVKRVKKKIMVPKKESALWAIIESPYGEIEILAVHVPNASKNGRKVKVATFDGIYEALSTPSARHRILCGDFNSPKKEQPDGTVLYFGSRKEHRQSEERVLSGLTEYDLADTYIKLCGYANIKHNGYEGPPYSHVNNNPRAPRRRFDHIFSSDSLGPTKCGYLHSFLDKELSDHAPVYAVYEPKIPTPR